MKSLRLVLLLEFLLVLSFLIANSLENATALFAHRAGSSILSQAFENLSLLSSCLLYLLGLTIIHGIYLGLLVAAGGLLNRSSLLENHGLVIAWLVGSCSVITANASLLPHTTSGNLFTWLRPVPASAAYVALCALGVAALVGVLSGGRQLARWIGITLIITVGIFSLPRTYPVSAIETTGQSILVIGLDSLILSNGLPARPECAPTISEQVSHSTFFANAYTPLARTHPSITSFLLGQSPHRHGVRFNLTRVRTNALKQSLPNRLQDYGYTTVFGTDEVRFSNIDTRYGFDHVISPPHGAIDFVVGNVHDDPLANLLVNTWLGEQLLPWLHGNRAAWKTYLPETYISKLRDHIPNSSSRPMFAYFHLTSAHWPYANARRAPSGDQQTDYCLSLLEADAQVAEIIGLFKERPEFSDALLVLISDHGERLKEPEPDTSRIQPTVPYIRWGHGSSVLDLQQYQVLISIKPLHSKATAVSIPESASLIDVAPTLLGILKKPSEEMEGWDWSSRISESSSQKGSPPLRIHLLESGLTVPAILDGTFDPKGVFLEAQTFYSLDSSGSLHIQDQQVMKLLRKKDYLILWPAGNALAFISSDDIRNRIIALHSDSSVLGGSLKIESEFRCSRNPADFIMSVHAASWPPWYRFADNPSGYLQSILEICSS